jgi:alginate O-acetyltransferase complex protein AlgI
MAFSNLFFLLVFLPVFMLIYCYCGDIKRKNTVLLVASLIFYAFGGIKYLLLLFVMAGLAWFFGILIGQDPEGRRGKRYLILSVTLFLIVLGFFKYTGFFLGTLGSILQKDWVFSIALPMGISFYTFKLISYVADVYHGKIEVEHNYFMLLLYTGIFHQSMQGPIVRYEEMQEELYGRKLTMAGLSDGIYRFSVGLAKKVVLADHCGELADIFVPLSDEIANAPTAAVWVGMVLYSMQLYIDFSAYTDMAIGLGQMIGFSYPENFNYPYVATSVRDFWRRWHMTLSFFFRDYVYIPLGGSRAGSLRTTLNLLVVWALTGLWHGSSWNFVLWGLYYFVFIVFENWRRKRKKKDWPRIVQHIYTIIIFVFGWTLFRFSDFSQLLYAIRGFFGLGGNGFSSMTLRLNLQNNIWFLIVCLLTCTPIFKSFGKYLMTYFQVRRIPRTAIYAGKTLIVVALVLLSIVVMTGNTFTPFLYNQF